MTTKSYSKHKEYKEFKSSGNLPYTDEQFDMIKSDLIPKSKLDSLPRNGGAREYHYEYKEEKHPTGKYDRKDFHTVEEYSVPSKTKTVPKSSETSSYYYERQEKELPSFNTSNSSSRTYNYETSNSMSPGYSKVKTSKATKGLSQNVEELDSLLDDLQKEQERQLYKGGYTSDTAESTSFDYKKGSVLKSPSSGYSSLRRDQLDSDWRDVSPARSQVRHELYREEKIARGVTPPPPVTRAAEMRQEMFREEKISRGVTPPPVTRGSEMRQEMFREEKISRGVTPPPISRGAEMRQEMYREEKIARGVTPPPPISRGTEMRQEMYREEKIARAITPPPTVTRASEMRQEMYREEKTESRAVPSQISPAIPHPVPAPVCATCHNGTLPRSTPMNKVTTTVKTYTYEVPADQDPTTVPIPTNSTTYISDNYLVNEHRSYTQPATVSNYHHVSTIDDRTNERIVYPKPANETKILPNEPYSNGYNATSYKISEMKYLSEHEVSPRAGARTPQQQQPPKKLDDLLADFPEARFPTQPDGLVSRKVEVLQEKSQQPASRNAAGPPVYYPPGHTPFAKEGYTASASQGGGAYASGKAMYEYESGSKTKEKHSEKKTAVPVCLPLCCAMPCSIM